MRPAAQVKWKLLHVNNAIKDLLGIDYDLLDCNSATVSKTAEGMCNELDAIMKALNRMIKAKIEREEKE